MFNAHSICVKHTSKVYYSLFNSRAKELFKQWPVMFAFKSCKVHMHPPHTIFQESPQSEVTGIQARSIRRTGCLVKITRSSPNWTLSNTVTARAMWDGALSSMNMVASKHLRFLRILWPVAEVDRSNRYWWWNTF